MKKTIFTACSIAIVCCAIIMACSKADNNSMTHVGYASQMGTGHNPNPNQTPTTAGYGTTTAGTTSGSTTAGTTSGTTTSTTSTTTPNTSGNITINGASSTLNDQGSTALGNYTIIGVPSSGTSASPQLNIGFSSAAAPATGSYAIAGIPASGQCQFNFTDAGGTQGGASSGSVSITTGSPNTCSFSNIICTCGANTYTVSGTLNY